MLDFEPPDEVDFDDDLVDDEEDLDLDFFAGGLSHAQKGMNESTCWYNQTRRGTAVSPRKHRGENRPQVF